MHPSEGQLLRKARRRAAPPERRAAAPSGEGGPPAAAPPLDDIAPPGEEHGRGGAGQPARAERERGGGPAGGTYRLEEQVGHLLRRAHQRHTALFARRFAPVDLTPLQFAVLMKLREVGPVSQNQLGRLTAMDPNTVQGVVLRLIRRRLLARQPSPADRRRKLLSLTREGSELAERLVPEGFAVSAETLAPLDEAERTAFLALLAKLA